MAGEFCDAQIYFVGAICHDIIMHVDKYPDEDEKVSTSCVETRRGGNSGNSLEVICQLKKNQRIYFLGAFGQSADTALAQDLTKIGVSLEFSVFRPQVENSTSYIVSTKTTRAVINYNPVEDMSWQEFSRCLSSLHPSKNWFHFEGRNIVETRAMITHLRMNATCPIIVSVEFEKGDRENIDSLIPLADVLFFSSSFAKKRGYECGSKFLNDYSDLSNVKTGALMFCSWGAIGSFGKEVGAKENETSIYFAGTPDVIPVDSVGAGDTWIASLISYLSENVEWREALRKSTWIASQKVAIKGFDLFSILSTQQFFDQAGL